MLKNMGEVEKPFSCPEQNCDMTFTNEDHLQVHKKRHEIQLSMNIHTNLASALVKHTGYLVDQTPTPTRFLKQCDEITLFQDINLNPFDYEFRKAAQYRSQLSVTENHGISNGSLETPRIYPLVDSDETISSTSRDDMNAHLYPSVHSSAALFPHSPRVTVLQNENSEKKEGRKKLTLNVSASNDSEETSNIISTPTPVITAGPSVSQALSLISCSTPTLNTPNIFTTLPPQITLNAVKLSKNELATPAISPSIRLPVTPMSALQHSNYFDSIDPDDQLNANSSTSSSIQVATSIANVKSALSSSVLPSPSATVLQLVLRLPNGQSIPVEIPATPLVTALSSSTTSSASVSIAPSCQTGVYTSVISNPVQSLAKMKLKEVLASSSSAARPGATKHSRATTANRIAEMTRTRKESGTSSTGGDNQDDSSSSSSNGTTTGNSKGMRRRRSSNPDESPEEKRRKFLERNRAAAVRCREKKKRLVQIIAAKSDELSFVNQKLQSEVSSLRSEVASLKCLLLRHKNCPVTLAMQGEHDSSNLSEQYPQTFRTFKVQDPSGIITEVSTPIISATQESGSFPKTVTFTPNVIFTSSTCSSNLTNSNFTVGNICQENLNENPQKSLSKLRKRSLSLSSISLSNSYCSSYVESSEGKTEQVLSNELLAKNSRNSVGVPATSATPFIVNDNSSFHPKLKSLPRIFVTTSPKQSFHK